jgi:hypothetical protein
MRAAAVVNFDEVYGHGLLADNRDEMLLNVQRSTLLLLWDMRRGAGQVPAGFHEWTINVGVDLTILYDRVDLGERVGLTVEEDTRFGTETMGRKPFLRKRKNGCAVQVTACRFPPMVPADETPEQCDKRRRKIGRERRKAMEQARHAQELSVISTSTGTMAERRLATLLAVLPTSRNEAITLAEAVERVARHEAWASLTSASIRELVRRMVHGKGGLIASRAVREDYTKLLIWRFAPATSDKASESPCAAATSSVDNLPENPCPSLVLIGLQDTRRREKVATNEPRPLRGPPTYQRLCMRNGHKQARGQDAGTEFEERGRGNVVAFRVELASPADESLRPMGRGQEKHD